MSKNQLNAVDGHVPKQLQTNERKLKINLSVEYCKEKCNMQAIYF
jgi:hypothetical protein